MRTDRITVLCAVSIMFMGGCTGAPPAPSPEINWNSVCGGSFEGYEDVADVPERHPGRFDEIAKEEKVEIVEESKNLQGVGEKLLSSPRSHIETCVLESGLEKGNDLVAGFEWVKVQGLTSLNQPEEKPGEDVRLIGDYAEIRFASGGIQHLNLYARCDRSEVGSRHGYNALHGELRDNLLYTLAVEHRMKILIQMARSVVSGMNCENDVQLRNPFGEGTEWAHGPR
ncbi:hypothetical protein JGS22_023725 [Streptomyces sp. P38-E01]|uniref:Lipoprotein n=1 Tax=Streptomyces tardus TaxID=2780544 RepID=A0A949JSR7_9ACTN|nr:hypothetical protein [Streptomyces tardus]MBU7600556.1 hypothetical protein [Streptomyces tardus]